MSSDSSNSEDTYQEIRMPPGFKTVALNHRYKIKRSHKTKKDKKKASDKPENDEPLKEYRSTSTSTPPNALQTYSERNPRPSQSTKLTSEFDHSDVSLSSHKKSSITLVSVARAFLYISAFSLALVPTILNISGSNQWMHNSEDLSEVPGSNFFQRQSIPFQAQFGNSELLMKVYCFIVPYIASSFCLILAHLLPNTNDKLSTYAPTFAKKIWHGQTLRRKLECPAILTSMGAPDSVSIGEIIGVIVFLSVNLATLGARAQKSLSIGTRENIYLVTKENAWEQNMPANSWPVLEVWGKALGAVAIVNIGWYLLMPVGRKSVLLEALGLSWNRAIKYHRWVGSYTILIMTLHGLFYFLVMIHGNGHPDYDPNGVMIKHNLSPWGCSDCDDDQRLRLRMNLYGVLSLVLVLEMGIFALPYFRRYLYEVFYYVHHLFILVLVFVCLHHKTAIIYLIPGVAIYSIDKLMGLNAYFNCCLAKTEMVSSDVLECSFKIDMRQYGYKAGQHVYVNVPSVSHLQWHPFYLSSGPNADPGELFFHIKETGESEKSWTRQVVEAGRAGQLEMRIDAFYGNDGENLADKKAVVLVAGGIGISRMISLGMDLVHTRPDLPVTILWVCRTVQEFEIFSNTLCKATHRSPNLTVKVWITLFGSLISAESEEEKCDIVLRNLKSPPLHKDKRMMRPSDEVKNHLFQKAPPGLEPVGNAVAMAIAMVFALAGYAASVGIAREKGMESQGLKTVSSLGIVMGLLVFFVVVLVLARPLLQSKTKNEKKKDSEINYDDLFSITEDKNNSIESGSSGIDTDAYRSMLEGRIGCRPDIQAEFQELARIHQRELNGDTETVGVLSCGPKAMTKAIRTAIANQGGTNAFFTFVEDDWEF